ncbi:MAG: helix-turn-helix transcriptional regulator [Proteobacteria bacterium]|nr:helix-turn-helix transcriptional regulator [Pseudomonadota bacterium]
MDVELALDALSALSHETRLWAFRLLVQAGPQGLPAGEIADGLGSRQNTMSSHLKILAMAGLIESQREGRSIVYQANYDTVRALVLFLMEDCCAGNNAVCGPVAESLAIRV